MAQVIKAWQLLPRIIFLKVFFGGALVLQMFIKTKAKNQNKTGLIIIYGNSALPYLLLKKSHCILVY